MTIVIIATINKEFRLPSVPIVGKKSHSVSLMGPTSWYWQNLHPVNFWRSLSCSYPHPSHNCHFCLFVSLHFTPWPWRSWNVGRPLPSPCSPPSSLGKLTKQRSLQKQRPWNSSITLGQGLVASPLGLTWEILFSTKQQALTNELSFGLN